MKTLKILVVALVFPIALFAQKDTLHLKRKTYFGLGLGLGSGSESGTLGDICIFLQKNNNYISIKAVAIQEVKLFGDSPDPGVSDISILVGRNFTFNRFMYTRFGSGLSFSNRISRGRFMYNDCEREGGCLFSKNVFEKINQRAIALPLELQYGVFLDATTALTVGLSANLNHIKSFYGISLGLTIGRLRDKIPKK